MELWTGVGREFTDSTGAKMKCFDMVWAYSIENPILG